MWTSTVIGFIVDAVALVALIREVNTPPLAILTIPNLGLGTFTIEWRDVTLVLLIYVGIGFTVISARMSKDKYLVFANPPLLLFHLFASLVLLWLIVFIIPFRDFQFYFHLAGAWLVGFIFLLVVYITRRHTTVDQSVDPITGRAIWIYRPVGLPMCIVFTLLIALPGCALLERVTYASSWWEAISSTLKWGLAGITGSCAFWMIAAIVFVPIHILISIVSLTFSSFQDWLTDKLLRLGSSSREDIRGYNVRIYQVYDNQNVKIGKADSETGEIYDTKGHKVGRVEKPQRRPDGSAEPIVVVYDEEGVEIGEVYWEVAAGRKYGEQGEIFSCHMDLEGNIQDKNFRKVGKIEPPNPLLGLASYLLLFGKDNP